ncbi:MAG: helix-hairpin-helix domain-containing protein [Oscillochloridaceae bacterium]|nr:helix-hairpin-helix domain-containing protein [Chloroflexaceae bacterium]MDW8390337.1 helix-hairpin-helix domain-containing protein [Oscillochloridaceae bacterium]
MEPETAHPERSLSTWDEPGAIKGGVIKGIGKQTAQAFHEAGIHTWSELARLDATAIAERLGSRIKGLTPEQIEEWRNLARALAETAGSVQMPDKTHVVTLELVLTERRGVFSTKATYAPTGVWDRWVGWNARRLEAFIVAQTGCHLSLTGEIGTLVSDDEPVGAPPGRAPALETPAASEPATLSSELQAPAAPPAPPAPEVSAPPQEALATSPAPQAPEALILEVGPLTLQALDHQRGRATLSFRLGGANVRQALDSGALAEIELCGCAGERGEELPLASTRHRLQPGRREYTLTLEFAPYAVGRFQACATVRVPQFALAGTTTGPAFTVEPPNQEEQ